MNIRFLILAFGILLCACAKDDGGRIPDVYVYYQIPVNHPSMNALNNAGGSVLVDGHGVAGLIIYKRLIDNKIVAYDRCSSVNPEKKCAVNIENTFTAVDPCSGAKFFLEDGSPALAPAKRALKAYGVSVNGLYLVVSN
ncbi:MAG: hypothetical protein RLZ47_214 [Bacteroidota bacterium]|jgi:hypothetical protein